MTDLVLLPGLDGTASLYTDLFRLCDAFDATHAIAYPTREPLDYAALEQLVRPQLPADRPFILLGESFSGPVAVAIAARPPDNLVGLVLSTSFAGNAFQQLRMLAPLSRYLPIRQVPDFALAWWLLGRWATPALQAALRNALEMVSPPVLRQRVATALNAAPSGTPTISVPMIYLRATGDRLMPAKTALMVRRRYPQCKIINVEGPHLLLQANPADSAKLLCNFARELSEQSATPSLISEPRLSACP